MFLLFRMIGMLRTSSSGRSPGDHVVKLHKGFHCMRKKALPACSQDSRLLRASDALYRQKMAGVAPDHAPSPFPLPLLFSPRECVGTLQQFVSELRTRN